MKHKHLDMIEIGMFYLAVSCALTPILYPFFVGTWGKWIWFLPLMNLLLLACGYAMQSVYAGRMGIPRRMGTGRSDITEKGFVLSAAAVPLGIALALSAASVFLYKILYYHIAIASTVLYKVDSLNPYFTAAGTFVVLACGIILWFYPPERIITIRFLSVVVFGSLLLICVLLIFGGGSVFPLMSPDSPLPTLSTICYFIFCLCLVYLVNQVYITRNYRGSAVSIITPEARLYNMRLVSYMLVAGMLILLLAYIVLSGMGTLLRMILFTTVYQLLSRSENGEKIQYNDPELAASEFREIVYRDSPAAQGIFYVFLILLAGFLVLIVFRKLRSILAAIGAWLAEIISFWAVAKTFWFPEKIEILNYTDEETKLQKASIRDYNAMATSTATYEDFIAKLNALPTMGEKLSFAYSMMLRACRKAGIQLKSSDTPREACEKLRRFDISDSEELTETFELVKYAERELGERTPEAIRSMCAVVKKYMF